MNPLYSELAGHYDTITAPFVETRIETDFLEKVLREHNAKSVLDIGCGTGRHAIPLSKRGFRVTGIDSSRAMIRIAKAKTLKQRSRCQFLVRDCKKIGLANSFEAAYCMWNTFYLLPYRSMLKSLHKALKEGGIFIIDARDWSRIRKKLKGKTQLVSENLLEKGKTKIRFVRMDTFTSTRRIVEVEYYINGKRFLSRDVAETIPLGALEKILEKNGFKAIQTFREFGKGNEESDSVQIIARKI